MLPLRGDMKICSTEGRQYYIEDEQIIKSPSLKGNSCITIPFFGITYYNMSHVMRKPTFWFLTWSDTNQAVQLQKMARGLKFRIRKVEGLYYLCSKNKGANQLRGHREADLRLCFRICKMLVFS